jgi:hypothetical protein
MIIDETSKPGNVFLCGSKPLRSNVDRTNGLSFKNGNSRNFDLGSQHLHCPGNGCIYADGDSIGSGFSTDEVTSKVDPVRLTPLEFKLGSVRSTWDEVWCRSTEEERIVLVQLLPLR